jgi:hypothetical protein
MAQLVVILICHSERGPPAAMRLLASSATERSMTQKAESIRSQGVLSPLLVRPITTACFGGMRIVTHLIHQHTSQAGP